MSSTVEHQVLPHSDRCSERIINGQHPKGLQKTMWLDSNYTAQNKGRSDAMIPLGLKGLFAYYRHNCPWIHDIEGSVKESTASTEKPNTIGYYRGKFIHRDRIRSTFSATMVHASESTYNVAASLFDRYGRLRDEFKTHPFKKGNGVWSSEFDHGDMLIIEEFGIYSTSWQNDTSVLVFNTVIDDVKGHGRSFFVLTHVASLVISMDTFQSRHRKLNECSKQEWSLHFWRSCGFRRVGSTDWFGYSMDPGHPANLLKADDDFDAPLTICPSPGMEVFFNDFIGMDDHALSERLRTLFSSGSEYQFLHQYVDRQGNTLLHILAIESKPESVRRALAYMRDLTSSRNIRGETPLEALQARLEEDRTVGFVNDAMAVTADSFTGFSNTSIYCLMLLRDITSPSLEEVDRLRFGCTCGECISGFLSPRMHFALAWQAFRWSVFLRDDISLGSVWIRLNAEILAFTPERLRQKLEARRAMREGFAAMAGFVATCLEDRLLPTEENLRKMVFRSGELFSLNYLQRGGTVSAVASMLFRQAMDSDELAGDSLFQDEHGPLIEQLVTCRNDHEFGFVSSMCGYRDVAKLSASL
ncbi:hypothetical protein BDV41DRAFT_543273 [Aspergillus transmontanensis]|uniref:Uncharacterized protein n=1 Tax=Aspergillus transmontanensis TaxID=1034304 RepID=A0A5N6VQV0_9EURO|nr:hypothetical protein BDV41DRAFT_543273 [Aspergillus transmontanensis]